jgi:hypothetical protein
VYEQYGFDPAINHRDIVVIASQVPFCFHQFSILASILQ